MYECSMMYELYVYYINHKSKNKMLYYITKLHYFIVYEHIIY